MRAIQCRDLVGRDAELEFLVSSLDQTDHDGGLILLAGEAGVGKSRMARELASIASARNFTIASGRAVQASSPVPLRPIVEALTGVERTTGIPDVPALAEYRPALASMLPDWGQVGQRAAEISPLILGEALLRLLTCVGGKGALLVLEDLHFADPETLAIVEYLADNLAGEPVLCVATLRDSAPSPALDMVRSLHARRAASILNIGRLAPADVRRMVADCLDQENVHCQVVQRLLADCDGLPFAVEEMLASAISSGELVFGDEGWRANEEVTTGVPTSIAESVRHRLAGLGQKEADVLVAAAVLGRQFDWTLIPAMVDATEAEVLAALQRACEAQLVEPPCPSQAVFRFRHSLTRDAIVSDLLPPLLARHAAAAAAAIQAAHPGMPGALCELAAELHEMAGQPVQAAALLLEAGRRSLQRGALTSAAASLARGRQELEQAPAAEPRMLADIDDTLSTVHMLAGDSDQVVQTTDRLIAELDAVGAAASRKAEARLRAARSLSECDQVAMAEQQVAAARALAEGTPDPRLGGWADAVAARCAIDAGNPDRALALAQSALASAEAAGLSGSAAEIACEALEVIGRRERICDTAAAAAAFERAYQISSRRGLPVRRIRAMHELGTIEMLEESGSGRLCEAKRLAVECGAVSTAAVLDLQLANAWSMGTDLDRALDAAQRSQQAAARLQMHRVEAMAVAAQACIVATRGEREHTESLAEQAEQIAPGDPSVLMAVTGDARVTAAIVSNDLAAALAASATAVEHARNERLTAPAMGWGYWPLLQAVAGLGGRDALRQAREVGAEVACWNRGCLAYAEAVLAGQDGQAERAAQLAEQGSRQFARCAPWWNHIMHRLVAPAAFRDGWGEPAGWLTEAIEDLDDHGFYRLASACRGILRQAGQRVPRCGRGNAHVPGDLRKLGVTSREMDVFLLVGDGQSSAEIAAHLFISPKTVETHVASLIAKLGLGCRRELVAHAARASRPE